MTESYAVRPVTRADLSAIARLAAELVRIHHKLDPDRYLLPDGVEEGYARFFGSQLTDPRVVLICATPAGDDTVVGYAYGRLEPRDWNMLLDAHGALHDVLVHESTRRHGLGERMVREACRRLEALGAQRVVLHTAVQNGGAQALFTRLGFRKTMIEMVRERDPA
jgi:ribosomal protein S18 acetylase RimI-like enzyme